jgi:hypothetical protein
LAEFGKWATSNANLLVVVLLALLALVIASMGLIFTLWIKPKLTALDLLLQSISTFESVTNAGNTLQRVVAVETKVAALPDVNALKGQVESVKETLDRERVESQAQISKMHATIKEAQEQMRDLGRRSLREGQRMLSKRDLQYAIEQADQDILLYKTYEKLSRLTPEDHGEAVALYEAAKKRRKELEVEQRQASTAGSDMDFLAESKGQAAL